MARPLDRDTALYLKILALQRQQKTLREIAEILGISRDLVISLVTPKW